MTCLCVSLFIGRGVLDEHACSCVALRKAFRAGAAPGSLPGWVAQQHAHAGLLSRRQEAGPDYGNEIDLRQILEGKGPHLTRDPSTNLHAQSHSNAGEVTEILKMQRQIAELEARLAEKESKVTDNI